MSPNRARRLSQGKSYRGYETILWCRKIDAVPTPNLGLELRYLVVQGLVCQYLVIGSMSYAGYQNVGTIYVVWSSSWASRTLPVVSTAVLV